MGDTMFSNSDIGIDLGTANVLVYSRNKGIVVNEPSVVAMNMNTNEVIAVGNDAKAMIGKTPSNINAIRPLVHGVIADYETTTSMLVTIFKLAGKKLAYPFVNLLLPFALLQVQRLWNVVRLKMR